MINISISNSSSEPLYQQLYDQIAGAIIKGELSVGSLLPPIRTVSSQLSISVISVKRAWEELERSGFINTAVGRGCFVAELSADDIKRLRKEMLEVRLENLVRYAKRLAIPETEFKETLKKLYTE